MISIDCSIIWVSRFRIRTLSVVVVVFSLKPINTFQPNVFFSVPSVHVLWLYYNRPAVVVQFNEIVINAHTWRTHNWITISSVHRYTLLLNEKQFLMWRQTMTSILDVRTWIRFRFWNTNDICAYYTQSTRCNFLPIAYIFPHRHTPRDKNEYEFNLEQSMCFVYCITWKERIKKTWWITSVSDPQAMNLNKKKNKCDSAFLSLNRNLCNGATCSRIC